MRQHFSGGDQIAPIRPTASADGDDLAAVSVGRLLERYAGVLAKLRLRGLTRTNNAPSETSPSTAPPSCRAKATPRLCASMRGAMGS